MFALFRFSLRQLIGRHRWGALSFWIVLTLLPAGLAALGVAFAQDGAQRSEMNLVFFNNVTLALVLPVLALLVVSSLLREEIQNQTVVYLYLKPLARAGLVLAPFASGAVVLLLLMALNLISVSFVFQESHLMTFLAVGALALLAYAAFFTALSLVVRRAVLWGLGYLLLWEGFLANLSRPASFLSIRKYLLNLEQALLGNSSEIPLGTTLGVLVGVVMVSLGAAIWRLWSTEFVGDAE
jgi:ABC-2 type transport system permease protein